MIQIRHGVFETNSSSTHSLTICMESDYDKWRNGEVLFHHDYRTGEDKFITEEEAMDFLRSHKYDPDTMSVDELHDAMLDEDMYSYRRFYDEGYLETFFEDFVTPNGEAVVAFGKYGYDG